MEKIRNTEKFHFYCTYDSIERNFDTLELSLLLYYRFDVYAEWSHIHSFDCLQQRSEIKEIIVGKQIINGDDGRKVKFSIAVKP